MLVYAMYVFFQAEDGIRELVRSRGLGDVYKRQPPVTGHLLVLIAHMDVGDGRAGSPRIDDLLCNVFLAHRDVRRLRGHRARSGRRDRDDQFVHALPSLSLIHI